MREDIRTVILNKHSYFGTASSYDEIEVAFINRNSSVASRYVFELSDNRVSSMFQLTYGDLKSIRTRAKELLKEPPNITQYIFDLYTANWYKQ